jgi:thioredoxin 1
LSSGRVIRLINGLKQGATLKIVKNVFLLGVVLLLFWLPAGCQSGTPPQTTTGEPTFELNIDILGRTQIVSLDSGGRLTISVALASPDGAVILSIDKGTRLLGKDGRPLPSVWMKTEPELLPLAEGAHIIGALYSLGPQDAVFDRPLKLTLSYDPKEIPEGVREDDVYIVPYEKNTGWGSYFYKRVDTEKHQVTTQIEHLTSFAVLAPLRPSSPQSVKTATPTPTLASIPLKQALSSGKPTLAEFGSSTCVPCKQMKPILEELAGEYKDKLNVVVVEVYEQMELTRQYGIMAIPTQIVFDSSGKEIKRHMGLWPKEDIIAQLKKMGVD